MRASQGASSPAHRQPCRGPGGLASFAGPASGSARLAANCSRIRRSPCGPGQCVPPQRRFQSPAGPRPHAHSSSSAMFGADHRQREHVRVPLGLIRQPWLADQEPACRGESRVGQDVLTKCGRELPWALRSAAFSWSPAACTRTRALLVSGSGTNHVSDYIGLGCIGQLS
jgi:hypothetical protein